MSDYSQGKRQKSETRTLQTTPIFLLGLEIQQKGPKEEETSIPVWSISHWDRCFHEERKGKHVDFDGGLVKLPCFYFVFAYFDLIHS